MKENEKANNRTEERRETKNLCVKNGRKDLAQYEAEICQQLTNYYLKQQNEQRRMARDIPSLNFKLNVHIPTVAHVANELAPDDPVAQLAALVHDIGRLPQYHSRQDFNDCGIGSDQDHHVIGYHEFMESAPEFLREQTDLPSEAIAASIDHGVIYQVSMAIKLHGLRGKAFAEDFAGLDPDTAQIVDLVSQIDDVTNGVQCVEYILQEGQEEVKNVSIGGFIPDENAKLKTFTPKALDLLIQSESFNRNAVCKTYPDYTLFGTFLATRALKSPATRSIARRLMEQPTAVCYHDEAEGGKIVSKPFPNVLAAFKFIYKYQMMPDYADKAYFVLEHYYQYACNQDRASAESEAKPGAKS